MVASQMNEGMDKSDEERYLRRNSHCVDCVAIILYCVGIAKKWLWDVRTRPCRNNSKSFAKGCPAARNIVSAPFTHL